MMLMAPFVCSDFYLQARKMIHTSPFRSRKKKTGTIRQPGLDWFDADNSKLWLPAAWLHWATDELFPSN